MTIHKTELNKRLNKILSVNIMFLLVPLMRYLSIAGKEDSVRFMKHVIKIIKNDCKSTLDDYEIKRKDHEDLP